MRRRELIRFLGAAPLIPIYARAQQSRRTPVVGVLASFAENSPEMVARLAGFRRGLEMLGWVEGQNLTLDIRYALHGVGAHDRARELVAEEPDLIFANSTPMVRALQRFSSAISIVFVGVSDPIGSGFISSLARPEGNLTGLLLHEEGIAGKWVQLLKEAAPNIRRVALCANPRTTPFDYFWRGTLEAARILSIDSTRMEISSSADIERSILEFARTSGGGLVFPSDSTITSNRDLIVGLTAKHKVPAVYSLDIFTESGGLMSYGTDRVAEFRQAATYVDRILRGAKPSDLPVQTPTKYETVLNLKTAKALGIEVTPTLLVRADRVIE